MALVLDCISFLASVLVSFGLRFASRTIYASPMVHKIVKKLDRGKTKVPAGLPMIGPWDTLSPLVTRINGLNPGMHTLQGTNCYLMGTGPKRILIDTGEGAPGFIGLLLEVMREVGCEGLEAILLTHWHADHVGGVNDILKALGGKSIPVYKRPCTRKQPFEYGCIEDGQLFRTQGATLEAVLTPGHTTDHVSFVLHEEQALITGDMILGCGTAIFADFTSYMSSLRRVLEMSPKYGGFSRLYCGHGPVVEAAEDKIKFYIAHRQEREAEIVNALTTVEGRTLSSWQIVLRVYGLLPLPVMVSAHYNVLHHMSKLNSEGRTEDGWLPCSFRLAGHRRRDKLQGAVHKD